MLVRFGSARGLHRVRRRSSLTPLSQVDYGNDLDTTVHGSGFPPGVAAPVGSASPSIDGSVDAGIALGSPEFNERTGWNLNNIPHLRGNVLQFMSSAVNGVNVPWLYVRG